MKKQITFLLVILFGAKFAFGGVRIAVSVDDGEQRWKTGEVWTDSQKATVGYGGPRPPQVPLALTPEQLNQLVAIQDYLHNDYERAVPHARSGAHKNATLRGVLLELVPSADNSKKVLKEIHLIFKYSVTQLYMESDAPTPDLDLTEKQEWVTRLVRSETLHPFSLPENGQYALDFGENLTPVTLITKRKHERIRNSKGQLVDVWCGLVVPSHQWEKLKQGKETDLSLLEVPMASLLFIDEKPLEDNLKRIYEKGLEPIERDGLSFFQYATIPVKIDDKKEEWVLRRDRIRPSLLTIAAGRVPDFELIAKKLKLLRTASPNRITQASAKIHAEGDAHTKARLPKRFEKELTQEELREGLLWIAKLFGKEQETAYRHLIEFPYVDEECNLELVSALKNPKVRTNAIDLLKRFKPQQTSVQYALIDLLKSEKSETRLAAAGVLLQIVKSEETHYRALLNLMKLSETNPEGSALASDVLAATNWFTDVGIRSEISKLLDSPDGRLREYAIHVVAGLESKDLKALDNAERMQLTQTMWSVFMLCQHMDSRIAAVSAILLIDPSPNYISSLMERFKRGDRITQMVVVEGFIESICKLESRSSILESILTDFIALLRDEKCRTSATDLLVKEALRLDTLHHKALLQYLRDPNDQIRNAAIFVLEHSQIRDENVRRAVETLIRACYG